VTFEKMPTTVNDGSPMDMHDDEDTRGSKDAFTGENDVDRTRRPALAQRYELYGERQLEPPVAYAVHLAVGTVYVRMTEGATEYEALRDTMYNYARVHGLRRDVSTGDIYEPVRGVTYAYEKCMDSKTFLFRVFSQDYRMLAKNQRYQRDLVESIRTTPDPRLPVLRVCKRYFGFCNGVYNIETSSSAIRLSSVGRPTPPEALSGWNTIVIKYVAMCSRNLIKEFLSQAITNRLR
ncbi:hypothetical protein HDU93_005627, partial [Gonapodya sp. JEL0774]